MSLYASLFYSSQVKSTLSSKQFLAYMLEVEKNVALAQASTGIIDEKNANIIAECCNVELIDTDDLISKVSLGGNAAIPLVKQLTNQVKLVDFKASRFVHLGLTSQDVIDTATVLCIKDYIYQLEKMMGELSASLVDQAQRYRETAMIGRTLLQHAKPITFGYKISNYLSALLSLRQSLVSLKPRVLKIQLGGAVGTRNRSISKEVQLAFAKKVGLRFANSWHSDRSSFSEFAAFLSTLTGSLGKIAKDISLLMQTEVAEVFEGAEKDKGGSSTMPHKRNPVTSSILLANAIRSPHLLGSIHSSMVQDYERSAGLWHAEWETLSTLMSLAAGSLEKAIDLVKNLEVDTKRMSQNLELTDGLIYAENVSLALSEKMGKLQAHEYVSKACKKAVAEQKHLLEVLIDQKIELENLDKLFKPAYSIGSAIEITDEVLENVKSYENQL